MVAWPVWPYSAHSLRDRAHHVTEPIARKETATQNSVVLTLLNPPSEVLAIACRLGPPGVVTMDRVSSNESTAVSWSLLAAGVLLCGLGLVLAVGNIMAAANDEDFTVSLGGLLFGAGLGLLQLAGLNRRFGRIPPAGGSLVAVGSVVTGWAVGGGLDELLQDHASQFVLAAVFMVIGVAVAAGGWVLAFRTADL